MKTPIIAISREFCSGGRLVGEAVAAELGVPFYDRKLIELAAEKSGFSADYIEHSESQPPTSFLYGLAISGKGGYSFHETPISDRAFFAQAEVIRELAAHGGCVIVGRCAGYILRENPNLLSVFLFAPPETRLQRARELYGMTRDDLAEYMTRVDKGRRRYHKTYTGETWNDLRCYDLCINTAKTDIDGAAHAILAAVGRSR